MIQGASLGFVFVPLTTITNNPIPNERMGNATSIFNLMRNIGASIGISMVETVQFRKEQVHINRLGAHIYPENLNVQQMMNGMKANFMSQGSSAATATQQAYGSMWGIVQRQAAMLSYNDTFLFLAVNVRADAAAAVSASQAASRQRAGDDALERLRVLSGFIGAANEGLYVEIPHLWSSCVFPGVRSSSTNCSRPSIETSGRQTQARTETTLRPNCRR